jgi:hypothetical protein
MSLLEKLEYFPDLQHRNGFVGHSFSLKAEGMFANQGGSVCAGMSVPVPEKSRKKVAQVAHFGPESLAQFSPEWVAQFGPE